MSKNSFGSRVVALVMALLSTGAILMIWNIIGIDELGRDFWIVLTVFYFFWRAE